MQSGACGEEWRVGVVSQGGPKPASNEETHHWARLEPLHALGEPRRVCRAAPPPREPRSQRQ